MQNKKGDNRPVTKRRPGITLVEVLGVMVVIAIIASIGIGSITSGQRRARRVSAINALEAYQGAFTNACVHHPGFVGERLRNYQDPSTYSGSQTYGRLVGEMNEFLEEGLKLYWDDSLKCFTSSGLDPWNGRYVLTEYPIDPAGSVNWFDPTADGIPRMCVSIWASGVTDDILTAKTVGPDAIGIALNFEGGIITTREQNIVEDVQELTDWTITMQ